MKKLKSIGKKKCFRRTKGTILLFVIVMVCMLAGCSMKNLLSEGTDGFEIVPENHELVISKGKNEEDTEAAIGSMRLTIPLGWKLEQRISDDGVKQYILTDIHSEYENEEIEGHKEGYEHEIVITPYKISRMPELSIQMAAEMKKYFSIPLFYGIKGSGKTEEIKGCWMYGENRELNEREYFLFSEDDTGAKELFHIKEGGYYVTSSQNAIEAFEDFIYIGLVRLDGGKYIAEQKNLNQEEYYYWLNAETQDPLFVVCADEEIAVYQKGNYQTAVWTEKLSRRFIPEWIDVVDVNQDGYEDCLCRYWLINPKYSLDYVEEDEFEGYLWDKDSNALVYVPGEQMLAQYGTIWENRKREDEERRGSEQIPQELIDYLSEYMLKSREELRDIMIPLVSDRELTLEEVKELSRDNKVIKNEFLAIVSSNGTAGMWLEVDGDNDGINDIFLCQYLGGSFGQVNYYFFKGTAEGSYELTDCQEKMKEEFAFINWEGKNYLARTTYEFTKKCVNGISLECYENGIFQGGVWLTITAKEGEEAHSIQTSYPGDEKYKSLAYALAEISENYQIGQKLPLGTAEEEQEEGYTRSSDIDNDGEPENYSVSRWETTNYYTTDCMLFKAEEEEIEERIYNIISEEKTLGIPMNLWVDETEYGNVTYILYEDELYDFHICGYLFTETDSRKVIQTDYYVKTQITPQSSNKPSRIVLH